MNDKIDTISELIIEFIKIESEYFIEKEEDNGEFIPRIEFIVENISKYLSSKGLSENIILKMEKEMIDKAKNIFIKEWLNSARMEDENEYNESNEKRDAIKKFNQYLKKKDIRTANNALSGQ